MKEFYGKNISFPGIHENMLLSWILGQAKSIVAREKSDCYTITPHLSYPSFETINDTFIYSTLKLPHNFSEEKTDAFQMQDRTTSPAYNFCKVVRKHLLNKSFDQFSPRCLMCMVDMQLCNFCEAFNTLCS